MEQSDCKGRNDPAFKKRLLNEPQKVLKENGIELPSGKDYKITENSDKIVYLNLPANPGKELQDELLKNVAGGPHIPGWFQDPTEE